MEFYFRCHAKLVCKAAAAFVLNLLILPVFNFACLNPDLFQEQMHFATALVIE